MNDTNRYYWKCKDCLRPFVVEGNTKPQVCSCGGKVYFMGKVIGTSLYGHTELTCECNEVCACASGPKCSCACGGKNHGKGLTVELDVVDGKISVKSSNAKHEAQGAEYREAMAKATARYEKRFGETASMISRGIRVSYPEFMACHMALKTLQGVRESKIHKTRIRMLSEFLPESEEK